MPDPTNSPLGSVGLDIIGGARGKQGGCMEGCIKGIVCVREEQRIQWLTTVECDVYEPVPNTHTMSHAGFD